jgi:hypothetical protein
MRLVILPSVSLFLVFQFAESAVETDAVVTADHGPALGALPLILFFFKKPLDAFPPDVFQILNQVHPEKGPVALIDAFQPPAGKIRAFIAIFYLPTHEKNTSLLEEGTLLASGPATDAVRHSDSVAPDIMLESKIATAYATVHAAGSN